MPHFILPRIGPRYDSSYSMSCHSKQRWLERLIRLALARITKEGSATSPFGWCPRSCGRLDALHLHRLASIAKMIASQNILLASLLYHLDL
jgi:hypothetical protein